MIQEFSKIEKYALMHILIQIMEADGIVDKREELFIDKMFNLFQITEKEVSIIVNFEQYQCENLIKEMQGEKKEFAKKIFYEIAYCDGILAQSELDIILKIIGGL